MLARKREINLQVTQLIDSLLLGWLFWMCHQLRFRHVISLDSLPEIPAFKFFYWILLIIMPIGPFLLEAQGFYDYPLEKKLAKSLGQIARAGVCLFIIVASLAFLLRMTVESRSVIILYAVLAPVALIAKQRIAAWLRRKQLRKGSGAERIIFAGEPKKIAAIEQSFTPTHLLEIMVVDRVDLSKNDISRLVDAIHVHAVGRVVLAFSEMELSKVQRAIEACELEGVEAWLCADFIRTSIARPTYETLAGKPMLAFRSAPEVSWALLIKATADRICALAGLVLLSPLMLLVAAFIRITSPGPSIFKQLRAGQHGKPFTMYKFRSMRTDAEMRRAELEAFNEMTGPVFKIESDPRVTPFGRWLRKTSIDELPQLVNVLRGEMSLVGPRPLPVYEVAKFELTSHRRRLSVKPGLTCLWQINGRSEVHSFSDWVRMDLEYIDNWSLLLDLSILVRTIPAVLIGFGAK